MPPKKKSVAGAATSSKHTRSSHPIVISNKGKEVETTAAAARPKRDAQPAQPIVPSTAPERRTNDSAPAKATANTSKKRGRPAKDDTEAPPAKKRGRPAKSAVDATPAKKGPGRPAKNAAGATPAKKGPGRPKKTATTPQAASKRGAKAAADGEPPKKRGRPSTAKSDEPAVPEAEKAPPKKRGRPPKGGETTKIEADDEAAAEQLEEELQDTAEDLQQEEAASSSTRKRKAPVSKTSKTAKAKGKAPKAVDDEEEDEEDAAVQDGGQNYWLMKAEQDGHDVTTKTGEVINTTFTIDDLRSKSEPEPWDGVRNPTAAKNMRDMKKGDLAFFYASGGKSGRKPGIVGIMEVVGEHRPDLTAWDEASAGYVEKEKDRNKWCVVHVEYRKKLSKPVFLAELQKFAKPGGALENMQEFRAARLSVSKVTEKEWDFIVENLVAGYSDEKEGGEPSSTAAATSKPTIVERSEKAADPVNSDTAMATVEADLPSTDNPDVSSTTAIADGNTKLLTSSRAPSRASSRADSRAASRATSVPAAGKAGSRAGSLAPPITGRRGRSVTPKAVVVEETTMTTAMQTIGEEDA